MVETLAPHGYARRLRTSLAACATFALGALAGGALTFGGLALAGAALGAGGPAAVGAAAVVAVAAAAARGARAADRAADPPPGAGGVAARAARSRSPRPATACCSASASPRSCSRSPSGRWPARASRSATRRSALAIGLAFGAGRALPVVALAPFAGTDRGGAITAAMCERPAILLGLRRVDAVALAACALALGTAPA